MASARNNPAKPQRGSGDHSRFIDTLAIANSIMGLPNGPKWREPPLRPPQPSFVDNKLERQGVLENMMPLGTSPSAKVKAGARADPLRRQMQSRGLDLSAMDETRSTPERSAVSEGTRAASLRAEGSSRPVTPPTPPSQALATPTAASPVRQEVVMSPQNHVGPETATQPHQTRVDSMTPQAHTSTPQMRRTPTHTITSFLNTPFAKAFVETRRRGSAEHDEALRALQQATHRDRELSNLLAEQADNNLTPELRKRLRKKIKRVKIEFRRTFFASPLAGVSPSTIGPNNSLALPLSKSIDTNNNNMTMLSQPAPHPPYNMLLSPSRPAVHDGNQADIVMSEQPSMAPATDSPSKDMSQSRRSSSSLSEVDNRLLAEPLLPPSLTPVPPASVNGKRPAPEIDPELEERHKRVRSQLVLPQEVRVGESSMRDRKGGDLTPAASAPKGPTLRLFSTRARTQASNALAEEAAAAAAAAAAATATATASPTAGQSGAAAASVPAAEPGPTNLGRPPKRRLAAPAPTSTPTPAPAPTPTTASSVRVKVSPQKKGRSTVVAGIGRLDGKRPETPDRDAQQALDSQSDNNDFCSACSGNGFLLCCDGCERSFHFDCADPPIDPDQHLDEPWFCQLCAGRRKGHGQAPPASNPTGLFSSLAAQLVTRNTTAFVLPRNISTFFEGVRMGADGEYQLAPPQMPRNWKRKTGYNEDGSRNNTLVQLFSDKLETKPILCSACGLSSGGNREIVQCDVCPLAWHMDCMNPPMASAPRQRTPWHCPAHATHAISSLDPLRHQKIQDEGIPPSHRVRRPRLPQVVDTHVRRGVRNNGLIEVQDDSANGLGDGDDDSSKSWVKDDQNQQGTVYRLPASGIIADFITKAKSDHAAEQSQEARQRRRLEQRMADISARAQYQLHRQLHKRTLMERKIALNLVQLKCGEREFRDLTDSGLLNLHYSLEAEAPDEIVDDPTYQRSSRDSAVASERKQLELMQALIQRRLEGLGK